MIRRALLPLLLAALFAGCQDENPLDETFTFTGLWETAALEGSSLLLEFEQRGDLLAGNIYLQDATGEIGDPIPIREGAVRGESVLFTYDFRGETVDGIPVDTVYFRGSRRSGVLVDMARTACWADTNCTEISFTVTRRPAGF
ncbi:MAG: hypothetical protein ABIK65_00480 [Candidatus Eisenbacteria bacterium]